MRQLLFSPEARADLLAIATHIAADDPERALSFVEELEARCADLLTYPEAGRPRPELGTGLRSKPHGRYLIFYTPAASAVRIERVLHGSRDAEAQFQSRK